jgi:O-antigen/teichoic acid export membrane protein
MEDSKKLHRDFQGNILLVLFLNAVIKPLYLLGIDRGVQNILPPEEYGVYFTLFNLSFIFQILSDFGLQTWLTRTFALNAKDAREQYPNFLSLKAILSLLYVTLTGLVAFFLDFWTKYPLFLTVILLFQLSSSFLLFLRATLSGLGFYRLDSILSITDKGISILVMGTYLCVPSLHSKITIVLFTSVQLLSILLTISIALFILYKNAFSFKLHFDISKLKLLLKEGLPYAILVLLMSSSSRIDTLIIPFFSSDKFGSSAIYAGSFRILEAVNIIGYLFAGLLLPLFSKSIHQKETTANLANISIRLLWTITLPLAIGFSIFSEGIILILYKNATPEMVHTFSILILALIPMSGNYIYGTLLTASGSLWSMNRIFVLILGFNLVLIFVLLPLLSIPGVALASLITQSLALILQINLCIKKQLVKRSLSLILSILIFSFLTMLFIFLTKSYLPFKPANIPFILLTGILCTGIAMISTGMIKKNEWTHLFSETIR